jgi:hypothetical protein
MMDDRELAAYQAQTNAEIDFDDAAIAWYFGTRELTDAEYDHFEARHDAEFARHLAAEQQAEEYAAWARANPAEHAAAVEAAAAQAAADPYPWGPPLPWPDREAEAG